MPALETRNVCLGYNGRQIVENLNLCIKKGKIVAILGPNGSGKSTVLKALSRNLKPECGGIYLHGHDIQRMNSRDVARQMAVLFQAPQSPGDLTIAELVEYGRFPHQNWWQGKSKEDGELVASALAQTGLTDMAERMVSTLSGGERQRAWIAMALAQKPDILMLDEPTTYLDLCHQLELLELVNSLNKQHGITVVMVLHDINHAAKYSDEVIILKNGRIFAQGEPHVAMSAQSLRDVFGVEADVWVENGKPLFIVRGLAARC